MNSSSLRRVAALAMLAALSYAVLLVFKTVFPIQIGGFLTLEPKDSLLAIAGFLFGPVAGLSVCVLVALVEMVTVSTTGFIGFVMNVLSSALFVCPAALIYRRYRTLKGALAGLLLGILLSSAGMLLWNYLITPLYLGVERQVVAGMLLPTILPFNLLKGGMNAAVTLLLYKTAVKALRASRLLPQETAPARRGISAGVVIAAATVLITLVLIALVWAGIL